MAGEKNLEEQKGILSTHKEAISLQRMKTDDFPSAKMRRCTYYPPLQGMDEDSIVTDDIIVEILIRLPAKQLARFKCVSKKWKNYISHDSHFRKIYRDIGGSSIMLGIFNICAGKFREFAPSSYQGTMLKNGTCTFDESLRFLGDHEELYIVASSNGFLLCSTEHHNPLNYFICNPVTKQCLVLPRPTKTSYVVTTAFICRGSFDTCLCYKVVRAFHPRNVAFAPPFTTLTIQVFFSEQMHEWKEFNPVSSSPFSFTYTGTPAVITEAGVTYWPAFTVKPRLKCVLVCDLQQQQNSSELEMIVLPGQAATRYGRTFGLVSSSYFGMSDGLIVFAFAYYHEHETRFEMWALDQINKEWSMKYMHVFEVNHGPRTTRTDCIEGVHPLDRHVLLIPFKRHTKAWYNVQTKSMQLFPVACTGSLFHRYFPFTYPATTFLFG